MYMLSNKSKTHNQSFMCVLSSKPLRHVCIYFRLLLCSFVGDPSFLLNGGEYCSPAHATGLSGGQTVLFAIAAAALAAATTVVSFLCCTMI